MAQKVAVATGAYSAAATWNSVTNTPTLHASTNITLNSTTGIFTATFTAPNTINACVGMLMHVTTLPVNATYVVTLQESGVDTAAVASILASAFPAAGNWIFFKFPTPYVFTTTGAGAYRFKITRASATTNAAVAADSGGSLPAYLAVDDRTGVPAATDDAWIVTPNGTGTVSVTLDGTQTIGGGGNTTGLSRRSITNAVTLGPGSLLSWDIAASATLTSKGNITVSGGGELRIGTVATPYPTAFVAALNFNENGVSGNYGLETYLNGKLTAQGVAKSSTSLWKTTFVSGLGTAASPLVVADTVDWSVGDEILVTASSGSATNYNETESRFIITKNSATSYVVSSTAGGAETALSFTHTSAYVLNVQRNVIIQSTTITHAWYYYNENTVAGDTNVDWARIETCGASGVNLKQGFAVAGVPNATANIDYSVIYRSLSRGLELAQSAATIAFTGVICYLTAGPSGSGTFYVDTANKTFIDCFAISINRIGFYGRRSATYTRCVAIGCNISGSALATNTTGGFQFQSSGFVLTDCEAHCNRNMGITLNGTAKSIFNNFLCGTKGTNVVDINCISDTFNDLTFINSTFGSATFVHNYLGQIIGSEVRFQKLNNTENNHIWYTATGIARNSGAGLVDTTTKTVGNFAVRLAPEEATTGFVWEFLIGISANSAASVFGFIQKNAAFGSDLCTVELFLPGSTVADASQTMGNTTGSWLVFSMAAAYTGSVAAFARVRITAKTTTAAAYIYVADLYNGTNVLTSFKAWNDGKPSPVFTDLLGDPASVWAILTSTLTTAGTIGHQLTNGLITLQADTDDIQTRLPAALTADGNIKADIQRVEGTDATDYFTALIATIFTTVIETGLTFKNAMRTVAASVAGKLSGAATPQVKIRNAVADDKDRITADVDANGNRTNVTYDFTD